MLVTRRHPRAAPRRPARAQQTVRRARPATGEQRSGGEAFSYCPFCRPSRRGYPLTSTALFTLALGLQPPWQVAEVAFDLQAGRIDFGVGFAAGSRFVCPHCGAEHQPVHDTQERQWRHLNFFQYQAYLHGKVPRVRLRRWR